MSRPRLSICVPSRNRQYYFQETIRALTGNLRSDIQFVFADNSDDAGEMERFMEPLRGDPRIVFLPPAGTALSMMDNWERCVAAATGDWVTVIGDDDYVDPNVLDIINRVEVTDAEVDVFAWGRLSYNWPSHRPQPCNIMLRMGTGIHRIERDTLLRAMFQWEGADVSPNCPFCIYHGAISRRAIDELKRRFDGKVFQYPTVDYENAIKMLFVARGFIYIERAMSILGACPQSNSAGTGNAEELRRKYTEFMRDVGRNMDEDPEMRDFPFSSVLGVTAAVGQVQHWYKKRYGYKVTGWEKAFAGACARNCMAARDVDAYERLREGYALAFSRWDNGRHARHFRPEWNPARGSQNRIFTGYHDQKLYFDENIADIATPLDLYRVMSQMTVPIHGLEMKFGRDSGNRAFGGQTARPPERGRRRA